MKRPIAILGAGNAASAFAHALAQKNKQPVHLYCIEQDVEEAINTKHQNPKYLGNVRLPKHVRAFPNIADALKHAHIVIVAVPSFALAEVMQQSAPYLESDAVIGCLTKGIDPETLRPLVSTISNWLPGKFRSRISAIGGPAVAHDIARDEPTGLLIAGPNITHATTLANALHGTHFIPSVSRDQQGVGYAMALKNVYAIPLGMCDGLGFGMNTKAVVLTLALEELARILRSQDALPQTAYSLAGVGDVIVTGFSPYGRNRLYGERLVHAKTKDPHALGLTTVEGIGTTALALQLIRRSRVRAPLLETVAKCLHRPHHFERPFERFIREYTSTLV